VSHLQLVIGRQQRLILRDLASHGVWQPGCGWGLASEGRTRAVLERLHSRQLVTAAGERYWLAPPGYAWLFVDAATDLAMCSLESEAYEQVTLQIAHLGACARLAKDGPVNWRGERV
jgi:hypothetical protein